MSRADPAPEACEDYHCRCLSFQPEEPELIATGILAAGYCRACWCHEADHGAGFRAGEQVSADQGRAAIGALFGSWIGQN